MKQSLGAKILAIPTPVWCIGTYDKEGKPNVMTAAWVGVCCSKPPCVTVSLRKATYTYGNIMEKKAYTVSIPPEKFIREADFLGIASGRDMNKFERCGLTPVRSDVVEAPYVKEFPVVVECRMIHSYEIGLHTHFVGEILDVKADEAVLNRKSGLPDMEKIKPILYGPATRAYHGVGDLIGTAFDAGMDLYRGGQ